MKNNYFAYFLDGFIMLIWGGMTAYISARIFNLIGTGTQPDLSVILGIYSGVTAFATTVVQYHRGSSMGSKQKDQLLIENSQTTKP